MALLALAASLGAAPAAPETVFNVTLNVNYYADGTADRVAPAIRRHAALVSRYGLRADYSFTWLAARMVAARDPGLFRELLAMGMGLGHHGANRPPLPTPLDRIQGLGWEAAVQVLREYEAHDLDPATGTLGPGAGGLAGLPALLGVVPLSTGRFVKAPVLFVAREHGVGMMVGLQSNAGAPAAAAWYLGALNRPEEPDLTVEPESYDPRDGTSGGAAVAALAARLADAAPDRTRFGALLIHDSELVGGSIANMRASGVPETRNEAYWAAYERLLAFLAARSDVRFATMADFWQAAAPDLAPVLSAGEVRSLAGGLLRGLPLGPLAGERAVTLGEAMSGLEAAVAGRGTVGSLPDRVATTSLLGPRAEAPASAALTLARADLQRAAAAGAGHDGGFVRSTVAVGGRSVNAAEYLLALAALVAGDFPAEVRVEGRSLFPDDSSGVRDALTRLQLWSYKPARLAF